MASIDIKKMCSDNTINYAIKNNCLTAPFFARYCQAKNAKSPQ